MPIPKHDITCNSRATKMRCNYCGASVWYFSCTCGSKVFFEDLGWPWPIHYCQEYRIRKDLEMLVDIDKMTNQEIYDVIVKRERTTGTEIDDSILQIVESVVGKRKSKLSIDKVQPELEETEISGKVMEFNNPINIYTKLGYDAANEMSNKLLGRLGSRKWAYARIRSNSDKRNRCLEVEVMIDVKYLGKYPIRINDSILGIAKGEVHSKGIVWVLLKHDKY